MFNSQHSPILSEISARPSLHEFVFYNNTFFPPSPPVTLRIYQRQSRTHEMSEATEHAKMPNINQKDRHSALRSEISAPPSLREFVVYNSAIFPPSPPGTLSTFHRQRKTRELLEETAQATMPKANKKRRLSSPRIILLGVALVTLCTLVFYILPGMIDENATGSHLVNSFYCAVMTLTT